MVKADSSLSQQNSETAFQPVNWKSALADMPFLGWSQAGRAAAFDGYKNLVSFPQSLVSLPLF
jgi:hypothetical protein